MKPENSAAATGTSLARARSEIDRTQNKRIRFTLEAGNSGRAVVLHCEERIIFRDEAQALADIVADVLPSARRMVLDLAGVDSVDSGGLGELVLTHLWAEAAGYTLKFASPSESVRHLFETTNLVSIFDVYGSVREALSAMVQEEIHSS
jgi:anti-sigma B factor antagonist